MVLQFTYLQSTWLDQTDLSKVGKWILLINWWYSCFRGIEGRPHSIIIYLAVIIYNRDTFSSLGPKIFVKVSTSNYIYFNTESQGLLLPN